MQGLLPTTSTPAPSRRSTLHKSSPHAVLAPVSVAEMATRYFSFYIHIIMATIAFPYGQLYQTSRMFDAACEHRPFARFIRSCITRHLRGDWGDCCQEDRDRNDIALQGGDRLFSVYEIPQGLFALESKIWIITEADRSYTTVLFPSEY